MQQAQDAAASAVPDLIAWLAEGEKVYVEGAREQAVFGRTTELS